MPCVVHPDINSLKMMQNQTYRSINLLPMSHIASQRQSSVGVTKPLSRCFHAPGIAGKHCGIRSPVGEDLRNRFANSHRSAGHHNGFPCNGLPFNLLPRQFHVRAFILSLTQNVNLSVTII
jgi:hypothetical protein